MSRTRGFLRSPFFSALLGGAVVAIFGAIAISAGWIETEGGSTTTVSTSLATPAANRTAELPSANDDDSNLVNEIYRRDGQGVAFISATSSEAPSGSSPFGQPEGGGTATGSGFLIDTEGHIITNSHVVEGADEVEVTLGSSETSHSAEVIGSDPATDVALLKVDVPSDQLHPLALGDSSKIEVGDEVIAIGNPFGLDRTVTSGIVSALQRQIEAPNGFSISHVIQTDAAINPGNSGGPLIATDGSVIGINSQIQTGTGGNVGIGFAVPINTARDVVRQLRENGEVEHAYLGINGNTVTPELARAVNLSVDKGALIAEVNEDGPADKAGLQGGTTSATVEGARLRLGGDIITELDGKPISTMDEMVEAVNNAKPGDKLELTIIRGDDTKTVTVTLGVRPASAQ